MPSVVLKLSIYILWSFLHALIVVIDLLPLLSLLRFHKIETDYCVCQTNWMAPCTATFRPSLSGEFHG